MKGGARGAACKDALLKVLLERATHYLRTRGPHFILPMLSVLALQVDVFGLGAATQAQSENTILRLTAPWYGAPEQESVVAVLIDKPYVELPSGHASQTLGATEKQ